ncbi:ribosomal RNA small subunit methyltransferase D [Anaplasma platys]|uniref:Ribosomal RNA small subunit methyltransferase D n=1 Tax=Anaplasma platys TaxID=949 RepID=A0A858PXA7_9RICK|nr:RsmD family RNA methyltransferase [Anaplasma platys]QJC27223.1 ribosomal RNA small subunit methyltransferase D [Anaplasma platys]
MIRITSGDFRGRRIFTGNALKARPAMAVIREAIFNILRSYISMEGLNVCDLFCGSGSLSFESLSRGAAYASMVDVHAPHLKLVKRTAASLGVEQRLVTICRDVQCLGKAERRHDLSFVDPPYDSPFLVEISLRALLEGGWCSEGSIVVLRVRGGEKFTIPERYELIDHRVYHGAEVLFLRATV